MTRRELDHTYPTLAAAFHALAGQLQDELFRSYTGMVGRALTLTDNTMHTPLSGGYSVAERAEVQRAQSFVMRVEEEGGVPRYAADPAAISKRARRDAELAVATQQAKVERKLGHELVVEYATLSTSGAMTIRGTVNGHEVLLEQRQVWKAGMRNRWGQLGFPFCQWPARLRVDGLPVTAADYAAAVASPHPLGAL